MSEFLDKSYEEILNDIRNTGSIPEERKKAFFSRAVLDVKLTLDLRSHLVDFGRSLDLFREVMDTSGKKMTNLTMALIVVAVIQAVAALIQAAPILAKISQTVNQLFQK